MIMVCSAPGIFGGDVLEQRVSVGPGARVLLVSQSALQVHPAVDGVPAVVHSRYHVESGGELHCHWDATIPFAHASLEQRVSIDLASGSRFVWSDALMSGRAARGESWQFASLDHELRLAVDGALQYLERYTLDPAVRAPAHLWRWGPAHYAGTALVYHDAVTSAFAERAQEALAGVDGVSSGVDLLEAHLVLARLLAAGGAPFTKARSVFRDLTLDAVFGAPGLVARR
jgi:urease accessory protein